MAKLRLTDQGIRGMKPGAERYEVADTDTTGLFLRVGTTGKKTFYWRGRIDGKLVNKRLGDFPALSLSKARGMVETARESGLPKEAEPPAVRTFTSVANEYLATPAVRMLKTADDRAAVIRRHITPKFGEVPLDQITRPDVLELLDSLTGDGKAATAIEVYNRIRAVIGYALEREYIPSHTVMFMKWRAPEVRRERVLNRDELRRLCTLLTAPQYASKPTARAVLFCLATGQRRSECLFIDRSEVDLERMVWTLPGERVKNARTHVVPLTPLHLRILGEPNEHTGLYFNSSYSKRTKEPGRLHPDSVGQWLDRLRQSVSPEVFTVHDLRRTFATLLGELKVTRDIRKKLLNHSHGDVTGIYDRYDYLDEKRAAMDAWCTFLETEVMAQPLPLFPIPKRVTEEVDG